MSDAITWHHNVDHFDGNPTATVALDRARWEAAGATFVEVDDGDDETPGLAVGQVDGLDFGVLDYGEGETFLLVAGDGRSAVSLVQRVLQALGQAGTLTVDREVVDVAGERTRRPALEDRVASLERQMELVLAGSRQEGTAHAAVPEAHQPDADFAGLTERELDIAKRVAGGASNSEIARDLWITEQTVKFHLSNTYRKLHVANRTELVHLWDTSGPKSDEPSRLADDPSSRVA